MDHYYTLDIANKKRAPDFRGAFFWTNAELVFGQIG
ncbi:hypothetical protein SAMN06265368_2849 [Cohaesibacter gelatinilyticus]|uniref:Uncharacterized protein n=1 Tax=Cohaesibacter gelatinilyticus TaxID=372072 RepID=A0A285PEW4_9HYPH|nr:hypothetical protein SAMN06265368_2849 [Cohaesibacter gelatinilyticus]